MELKDVGEFGLIDILKQDTIHDSTTVVVGIGDDAAVLKPVPDRLQLVTADMLVEGVHFNLSTTTEIQLGHKAIAVNISDIAAMGGTPRHAVISIALPATIPVDFVTKLYQGMKDLCRLYGVNIVGGDTVSSPGGLVINVTALGDVEPHQVVCRSGAKVGDIIAVTNTLGSSAAGLDMLKQEEWQQYDFATPLVAAHLTPYPQVKAGAFLAAAGATSMDDISDGLASELHEIAAASNVSLAIQADLVPLAPEVRKAAKVLGKDPLDYALYGGEDFQLLFTMKPEQFRQIKEDDAGAKVVKIGEVLPPGAGVTMMGKEGQIEQLYPRGYNHFSSN